ncbi:MAG: toll/interleukin-1 receptor domain-containing protein [Thiolinea sp.]
MSAIFISYAHIDNQPFQDGMDGWISCFVRHLRAETNRRMGRPDDYSVWMDFKLKTNDTVTPEIEQQLRNAEILIILMSRGWLRSEWCVKELDSFVRSIRMPCRKGVSSSLIRTACP